LGLGLAAEYEINEQWVAAVIAFSVVFMLVVNVAAYNVSGMILIRILRKHQFSGVREEGDSNPFDVVISKTARSMCFLTLPSLTTLILFLILGVEYCNNTPFPESSPNDNSFIFVIFAQLILGLVFTRVVWISKTTLDAEIVAKTITEGCPPPQKVLPSSAASQVDLEMESRATVVADGFSSSETSLLVQSETDV